MIRTSKEFTEDFRVRYAELAKRLMVLHLLEKPMNSYELSMAIHEKSNQIFPMQQVLSVLVVLEQIEAVTKKTNNGKECYALTQKGEDCLRLCREEFYSLGEGVKLVLDDKMR